MRFYGVVYWDWEGLYLDRDVALKSSESDGPVRIFKTREEAENRMRLLGENNWSVEEFEVVENV